MFLREKIAKWLELITPILWFFVVGIGFGILGFNSDLVVGYFLKFKTIFLFFFLGFFVISIFLPSKIFLPNLSYKRLFLILVSFCFGVFWYIKTATYFSPTHLTLQENGKYKFITSDISKPVIIYGTIISDPDIREDSTNIVIKPDIIEINPERYTIELDTSNAKVIVEKEWVVRVIDGDTFVTKSGQKVRLMGINAPELGQPKADDATQFLAKKVLNKEVELVIQEDYIFDVYDRVLAVVLVDGENINKLLLDEGLAEIYDDPNIRIIQRQKYGEKIKIKYGSGLIRAKVMPTIGDYYFELNYGDYVKIVSPLMLPRKATNPAGFDYRKYLNTRGIYAVTKTLRSPQDIEYKGVGKLNLFVKLSYVLRKRLLLTIRKTVPYPQSAFLGGVTLGYRGGVPQKIREQFQATGVAHVLALSGLHTGFIAALLLIICNIFRIKSVLRFVLVSIALSIFVVMTGASPATVRSALMFCIGLFMYDVLKLSLKNSSRITIVIAACIILFFNPRLLPDASFVLSFMAVWSLVYVSPFVESILLYSKSKFIHQFVTFPLFSIVTGMTMISLFGGILQEVSLVKKFFPFLMLIPSLNTLFPKWFNIPNSKWLYKGEFFLLSLAFYICGVVVHYLYSLSGKMLVKDMRSNLTLRGLLQFVSAQVAIQIGMMWPLSSIYFYRFPIAGFYANFLAIPLIGWIVQLGWIAGLIDLFFSFFSSLLGIRFISEIGLNIALIINAFNNQLCQAFLGMSKTWGEFVPYPYVEMFSYRLLVLWYFVLLAVIFKEKIINFFKKFELKAVIFLILILSLGFYYFVYPKFGTKKEVEIVFFDVGFGNSVLVKTPKKNILIDTGPSGPPGWSAAESAILPSLTKYGIKKLDSVIITSIKPQCLGGAIYILSNFRVDKLYLPRNFLSCLDFTFYDFIEKQNLWYYMTNPYVYELTGLFVENYKLSKFLKDYHGNVEVVSLDEEVVDDENIENKSFKVVILSSEKVSNTTDEIGNNSLCVKISYGDKSILVAPQLGVELQDKLVLKFKDRLKSEIFLIPQNGNFSAFNEKFVKIVSPEIAICQYGWTNQRIGFFPKTFVFSTQKKYTDLGVKFLRTDYVGAVIFNFVGKKYWYNTTVAEEEQRLYLSSDVGE